MFTAKAALPERSATVHCRAKIALNFQRASERELQLTYSGAWN